ncbi:MAG TPA: lysophospholipid acyltransferase family protein [Methylovirgula sp.]|jgi:1-acyl-sn-glycerol-3-phosphate acyltransferase
MLLLRSIFFNCTFYVALILLMIVGLPTFVVGRRGVQLIARLWAKSSLVLLKYICGLKVEFRGLERVPKGAAIIASKHQSTLETFALLAVVDGFTFVHKRELSLIPLFGWYLWGTEQISIDRANRAGALGEVVRGARGIFEKGRRLILFPEGTRRPVGAPPDYKASVALVQKNTGVPCVPVALNTGLFWPRRRLRRYPGTAVIEFLEPIPPGESKARLMAMLQERIETATDRLVADACAQDPSLPCAKLALSADTA